MKGIHQYRILTNAHSREHLLEYAKSNGIQWEEISDEGINWMRASIAIVRHIDSGKEFDMDNIDEQTAQAMLEHYKSLKQFHKQTMVPLLRSAMAKLYAEKGDPSSSPMDLIDEAHDHLRDNGGEVWAEKLRTLHHINTQIKYL